MPIPYKLKFKDETIPFSVPCGWFDITAEQYMRVIALPDEADETDVLATVTSIDKDIWLKADEIDLYNLVQSNLLFLWQPMPSVMEFDHIIHVNGRMHPVIKDLGFLSVGQWKDIEKMCLMPIHSAKDQGTIIKCGMLLCAIYLQPTFDLTVNDRAAGRRHDYNYSRAVEISDILKNIPVLDILRMQEFFFLKTTEFAVSTLEYLMLKQEIKNYRQESTNSKTAGASTLPTKVWPDLFKIWKSWSNDLSTRFLRGLRVLVTRGNLKKD